MNNTTTSIIKPCEVNDLLQQLLLQIQSILSIKFIGMYIGGSIANQCFNPNTSDIDCYIITSDTLSTLEIRKIKEMHQQFYASPLPFIKQIEISYIPQHDLLNFDPDSTRPYFNEGNFYLAPYGNNFLIELFLLREKGLTLVGPNVKDCVKEISSEALKHAIENNMHEYWEQTLNNTFKFKQCDYQLFAVFTMCRTLYSLKTGGITSKINAAHWAIHEHPRWKNLIEHALNWHPGTEFNNEEEIQQFIKYTLSSLDQS